MNNIPGTRKIENIEQLRAGNVIRRYMRDGTLEPFSDCVILKIDKITDLRSQESWYEVSFVRPYAYASGIGSGCPTPLTWAETVNKVGFDRLKDTYVQLVDGRGEPYSFAHEIKRG